MKSLNVTDTTYEELYRLVVPQILKEHGTNVSQNDVVREMISVYVELKRIKKVEVDE